MLESRLKVDHIDYDLLYPKLSDQVKSLVLTEQNMKDNTNPYTVNRPHSSKKSFRHEAESKHDLNHKFHAAVMNNNLNQLENLLLSHRRRDFDINSTLIGGLRAIHIAAQLGLDDILDILKVNGAAFVTEKSPVHPIFVAATHGRIKTVQKLLRDYNVDINIQGHSEETLLHIAASKDDKDMLTALLKMGANPDIQDEQGLTPILLATLRGNLAMFTCLKEHKACLGIRTNKGQYLFHFMAMHEGFFDQLKKYRTFYTVSDDRDCTCLHFAITSGNLKAAKQVLKHGIHQLDLLTADRHTAITLACAASQATILDFLLTKYYKSKKVQPYETPIRDTLTPTHVIAQYGNLQCIQVLEKHDKLDINNQTKKRRFAPLHLSCIFSNAETAHFLIDKNADIKLIDGKGWYPLQYAVQNQMVSVCEKMLPHFSPEHFVSGTTPLHLSCKAGNFELTNMLLEANHDPTVLDKLGYSSLHYTASRGYVDILQVLLKSNAKVHRTSTFLETPLFLACINGRSKAVKLLKEAGANVNIPNQEGKKAFHEACRRGYVEVIEVILAVPRMKFDIDALSADGFAPLHVACFANQPTIAGILLREGAEINIRDFNGMTPLHHASVHGNHKIVESLLQLGAKRKLRDYDGFSAIDHAIKHKHEDIAEIIRSIRQSRNPEDKTKTKKKQSTNQKPEERYGATVYFRTNSTLSNISSIS